MERCLLEQNLADGLSLEQIGRKTGFHASTVAYWAKKHGLRAAGADRFAARGAPDQQVLKQLVAEGATLHEMAEKLDRSTATVRHWLRKWQIERPRPRRRADPASAPGIIEGACGRHGLTPFRLEARGYYRCTRCRQEYVSEWRRRVKRTLVAEAGGKCGGCGYDRCIAALQFTISTGARSRSRYRRRVSLGT